MALHGLFISMPAQLAMGHNYVGMVDLTEPPLFWDLPLLNLTLLCCWFFIQQLGERTGSGGRLQLLRMR